MKDIDEKTLAEAREKIACKVDLAAMAAAAGNGDAAPSAGASSCGTPDVPKKKVRLTEMTSAGG